MIINFYFGCSFVGIVYYMTISGVNINLGSFSSNENEAKSEAIQILKQNYKLDYKEEDITFMWDGTL
jgi:hypothetical protein